MSLARLKPGTISGNRSGSSRLFRNGNCPGESPGQLIVGRWAGWRHGDGWELVSRITPRHLSSSFAALIAAGFADIKLAALIVG